MNDLQIYDRWYLLKHRKAVKCVSMKQMNQVLGRRHHRCIRRTWVGEHEIITSFLGLDHSLNDNDSAPLIFETINMTTGDIFGRARTHRDALKMHWSAVKEPV